MRRYQLVYLCLVLTLIALLLIPSKHARRSPYPSQYTSPQQRQQDAALKGQHPRASYFSFNSPLFPASAIISLTDDNSTFFLSRPAAFGSALPDKGLSGRLWIGRGFGDEAEAETRDVAGTPADASQALPQGELGCSDVPGWDESLAHVRVGVLPHIAPQDSEKIRKDLNDGENSSNFAAGKKDGDKKPGSPPGDGTDDFLHEAIVDPHRAVEADITGFNQNSDIQSIQEKAEIGGKVVLLSRGGCGFLEKVKWAQRRGGIAVIVGDNIPGGPLVTMYAKGDTTNVSIPALFTSYTTAHLLSSLMPPGGRASTAFAKDASRSEHHEIPVSRSRIGQVWDRILSVFGFHKPSPEHHTKGIPPPDGKIQHKPRSGWFYKTPTHPGISGSAPGGINPGTDTTDALADELSTTRPDGLWVTLTPTSITTSPFIDTLLVLVVSPVVTLTVVYAMLLVRSRIRRRRWRAPKSVVERLPVRTYHTIPPSSGSSSASLTPTTSLAASAATPLLHASGGRAGRRDQQRRRPRSQTTPEATPGMGPVAPPAGGLEDVEEGGAGALLTQSESREKGLARWRRRYSTRQRECVVCLEEYVDGVSRVMSLPCGHEFHVECM